MSRWPMGAPGWVPCDQGWWAAVAAALEASGQPWPEEAIYMDLRWWADQERLGLSKRPGRPTLRQRWGVSDRHARRFMSERERWADQHQPPPLPPPSGQRVSNERPATARGNLAHAPEMSSARPAEVQSRPERASSGQRVSSERPADVQRASSGRPAATTEDLNNPPEMSSERPADVQRTSNECPTRVLTRGKHTDHRSPTQSQGSTHTSGGSDRRGSPEPAAGGRVCDRPPPEVPLAELARRMGLPVDVARSVLTRACSEIKQRYVPVEEALLASDALLAVWRARSAKPEAFLADVALVARACREAPATIFARLVRGEGTNWGDHSRSVTRVLQPAHWPDRLEAARAWEAQIQTTGEDGRWGHVDAVMVSLSRCFELGQQPRPVGCHDEDGWALCEDPERHDWLLAAVAVAQTVPSLLQTVQLYHESAPMRDAFRGEWPLEPDGTPPRWMASKGPVSVFNDIAAQWSSGPPDEPAAAPEATQPPTTARPSHLRVVDGGR